MCKQQVYTLEMSFCSSLHAVVGQHKLNTASCLEVFSQAVNTQKERLGHIHHIHLCRLAADPSLGKVGAAADLPSQGEFGSCALDLSLGGRDAGKWVVSDLKIWLIQW